MLYLPESKYMQQFKVLEWPLPPKLLPWLYARGLGIYVLPPEEKKARLIVYKRLRVPEEPLSENDARFPHVTPHYRYKNRVIILPYNQFLSRYSVSIFLHELGHAIDHLYSKNGTLSAVGKIKKLLKKNKFKSSYCEERDAEYGAPIEHFAESFSAYFFEPEAKYSYTNIQQLDSEFIAFMNKHFIAPFER